jgi:hypothetical protein
MDRFKITCCHNCPDRYPGCHGACDKYKQQRAEYDATKAKTMQEYLAAYSLNTALYDSIERNQKRSNYRSRSKRGYSR